MYLSTPYTNYYNTDLPYLTPTTTIPDDKWTRKFIHMQGTQNDTWNPVINIVNYFSIDLPDNLFIFFWSYFVIITVASYLFYSYLGLTGYFIVNALSISLFWLSLLLEFNNYVRYGKECLIVFGEFSLVSNYTPVAVSLLINKLSFGFAFLTTSIAFFVYFYTYCYFRYDENVERLVFLLLLFVNSMLLLVLSGNLVVLFLGWELIGVTSFFLINFWSTRVGTFKAALKAATFNKFSDICVLLAIILSINTFQSTDILVINLSSKFYEHSFVDLGVFSARSIDVVVLLMLLAAFTKSAQFGFHLWLPDSMEAPAPASALIHSATLVSAGIFLVLRFSPIMEMSILSKTLLPFMGGITAFFGGVVSAKQTDVKRILAYSTISHCGFMMLLASSFNLDLTLLYLYVHGLFKALLFLATGSVMRFFKVQDFRYMGGAYRYLPIECATCIFGFLHLSGAPFSFGYLAKHYIITSTLELGYLYGFLMINILFSIFASIVYTSRFLWYVFFDIPKGKKSVYSAAVSADFLSKYSTNTTHAGSLILFLNYLFAIILCFYVHWLWVPDSALYPTLYDIEFNSSIGNTKELYVCSNVYVGIVIFVTFSILLFSVALIFADYKKATFPEYDLEILGFILLLVSFVSVYFLI